MVKYDRQDNEPIVIAIIRDRGTFGHFNVAKALMSLDITCIDITFTDLIEKEKRSEASRVLFSRVGRLMVMRVMLVCAQP